jgi:hypothetical protein
MEMEKNLLMYFHTSFRNIGIFTTLSFAALGYSRYHRSKHVIYNIYLILVSIFFLICSMYIGYYLREDINTFLTDNTRDRMKKWMVLSNGTIIVNAGTLLLGLYTLYREGKLMVYRK